MQTAPPSNSLVAGKYQLLGLIGRGGMGSVWEGRHISLGTRVAIKFIEKEYADSAEARKRFDNEAHAAAQIQSKHAIQIYDHGVTDDGKPYIVMEMLIGEPLDKRLEHVPHGRIPLPEVARMLNQVSRALQRAHERGIVHRDLKPENIFLVRSPDDDEEIAKVLDFGIAKIRGPEGQPLTNSTKTGAVLGTPYYMSPEQARGLRDVDHRTDLWSLAVIVFKCVTGVLPFDGESLGDLLVKICTSPVPIPSHVVPGLPSGFDRWFGRAMERDPQRRFATAQEMADELSIVAGVSVKRAPSSSEPDQRGIAHARTVPSTPPPGYTPMPHASTGSSPSGGAFASGPRPNVTAAGLSASASRSAPPPASSPIKWMLGGAGVLFAIGAIVAAAVVITHKADQGTLGSGGKTTSPDPTALNVVVPGASIQIQTPPQVPTIPSIAETAPPAPPVPTTTATNTTANTKPTTHSTKPTSGSGHTTTTTKPSTGKPQGVDPGF